MKKVVQSLERASFSKSISDMTMLDSKDPPRKK